MLKVFILFVLFSIVLAQRGPREKLHEAERKCETEHHVTTNEINEFQRQIADENDKFDRKYKCYVKCVVDELDIKDESGKLDLKQLAQVYNRTEARDLAVIADCVAKHDSETDECERQFKTISCVAINFYKEYEKDYDDE